MVIIYIYIWILIHIYTQTAVADPDKHISEVHLDPVDITFGEVSALYHEVLYNSMKCGAFEAQLFPCDFANSPFTCNQIRTFTELSETRKHTTRPANVRNVLCILGASRCWVLNVTAWYSFWKRIKWVVEALCLYSSVGFMRKFCLGTEQTPDAVNPQIYHFPGVKGDGTQRFH